MKKDQIEKDKHIHQNMDKMVIVMKSANAVDIGGENPQEF